MSKVFFPKLAKSGMTKNYKLYIPYLLSCIGMIMMLYIICALSYSETVATMAAGRDRAVILRLGVGVICIFGSIFLIYTNSFLIKRRYREFGLYSILGMDRKSIGRVVFWESVIVSFVSLFVGLFLGILFFKFAELFLIKIVEGAVTFSFKISAESVLITIGVFSVIFLIIMLKSLIMVGKARPLELLRTTETGEKPPKANFVLAIIGAGTLAFAYYNAVTIESPLAVLYWFFLDVVLVIIATYILFIAGSVALCKLLKKNKNYYYKKQHFVSVSTMAYRMKRNGAGLASICILATMVLVMISSSASLYFGENYALRARYPMDVEFSLRFPTFDGLLTDAPEKIDNIMEDIIKSENYKPAEVKTYKSAMITGLLDGDTLVPINYFSDSMDDFRAVYIIGLDDYNAYQDEKYELKDNEIILGTFRCNYKGDSLNIAGLDLKIKERSKSFDVFGESVAIIVPTFYVVVKDLAVLKPIGDIKDADGANVLYSEYYYGYNYDERFSKEESIEFFHKIKDKFVHNDYITENEYIIRPSTIEEERSDFNTLYGGLFFVGIMLSIVFIFAAAVIIYYKQICEGYEDKARFSIMKKVGMTGRNIKKSINSQVLTVFFAPLLMAGMHLAFAFPVVWKLLQLFGLTTLWVVVVITLIAFVIYGIFYAIIYKGTAGAYYNIVSNE